MLLVLNLHQGLKMVAALLLKRDVKGGDKDMLGVRLMYKTTQFRFTFWGNGGGDEGIRVDPFPIHPWVPGSLGGNNSLLYRMAKVVVSNP